MSLKKRNSAERGQQLNTTFTVLRAFAASSVNIDTGTSDTARMRLIVHDVLRKLYECARYFIFYTHMLYIHGEIRKRSTSAEDRIVRGNAIYVVHLMTV